MFWSDGDKLIRHTIIRFLGFSFNMLNQSSFTDTRKAGNSLPGAVTAADGGKQLALLLLSSHEQAQ